MPLASCEEKKQAADKVWAEAGETPSAPDLADIQAAGEIIILTQYGPDTYFEFKGKGFGNQYMIAEEYARNIGVRARVEVARSDSEMVAKLRGGDGDIVACALRNTGTGGAGFKPCGGEQVTRLLDSLRNDSGRYTWAVRDDSPELAASLSAWLADNEKRFADIMTIKVSDGKGRTYAPRRKAHAVYLDLAHGKISAHDHLFRKYAATCGWDWRLLAAQAYQESAFDPEAVSWAGAMGLMQLMPATAASVGVGQSELFSADASVRGAAKYISQLEAHYSDIKDEKERIKFVLAAYNAGPGHVDDARRLAEKYGRDKSRWDGNVDRYVLEMSQPRLYNDPVVRHGYFRGRETYGYVSDIMSRWSDYKSKIGG